MIEIYDHQYNGFAIGELPVNGPLPIEASKKDRGTLPLQANLGSAALPPQAREDLERIIQLEAELNRLGGPVIEVQL